MNSRDYKIFRPGEHYHIYNRGDNRELIFCDHQDYLNFLKRFKIVLGLLADPKSRIRPVKASSFEVLAYCLMPNHFHFLIRQNTDLPISELMNKVSTSYAKYFNGKNKRVGNVFQDTFKAIHVDNDSYLTYLSAYIHNNPADPFKYQYSSLASYLGFDDDKLCNPKPILKYFHNSKQEYRKFVEGYTQKMHERVKLLVFDEN